MLLPHVLAHCRRAVLQGRLCRSLLDLVYPKLLLHRPCISLLYASVEGFALLRLTVEASIVSNIWSHIPIEYSLIVLCTSSRPQNDDIQKDDIANRNRWTLSLQVCRWYPNLCLRRFCRTPRTSIWEFPKIRWPEYRLTKVGLLLHRHPQHGTHVQKQPYRALYSL